MTVKDKPKQTHARTWFFEWQIHSGDLQSLDGSDFLRAKLEAAQRLRNIRSLQVASFACSHSDTDDTVNFSGVIHCKEMVREVTIQAWIQENEDNPATKLPSANMNSIRWIPCSVGLRNTWKDHDRVRRFLSDANLHRVEWGPVSSDAPVIRGRPRKPPAAVASVAGDDAADTRPVCAAGCAPVATAYCRRLGRPPTRAGAGSTAPATITVPQTEREAARRVLQSRRLEVLGGMLLDLDADPSQYCDKKGVIEALLDRIDSAAVLRSEAAFASNAKAARLAPTAAAVLAMPAPFRLGPPATPRPGAAGAPTGAPTLAPHGSAPAPRPPPSAAACLAAAAVPPATPRPGAAGAPAGAPTLAQYGSAPAPRPPPGRAAAAAPVPSPTAAACLAAAAVPGRSPAAHGPCAPEVASQPTVPDPPPTGSSGAASVEEATRCEAGILLVELERLSFAVHSGDGLAGERAGPRATAGPELSSSSAGVAAEESEVGASPTLQETRAPLHPIQAAASGSPSGLGSRPARTVTVVGPAAELFRLPKPPQQRGALASCHHGTATPRPRPAAARAAPAAGQQAPSAMADSPPAPACRDARPDPFAHMLGGAPWPEGAQFPSVTAMVHADLEHFLGSFGLPAVPNEKELTKLCRRVWEAIPPEDGSGDYGRDAQESLVPGNMIDTRAAVWLLRGFAAHCGFTLDVPGCHGADTPTALKCRVHMDRQSCQDQRRIVVDVEVFNHFTRDYAAYARFTSKSENSVPRETHINLLGPEAVEGPTVPCPPSPPDLSHRLRCCLEALRQGAQFCYLQLTGGHASAGVIDTLRDGDAEAAVWTRFCSAKWPALVDECHFVEHIVELLGKTLRTEQAAPAMQLAFDCQFRATLMQLEFMLRTVGGTSSPDADPLAVHADMQRLRTWSMFRMSEEACAHSQNERTPLVQIIGSAISARQIPIGIITEPERAIQHISPPRSSRPAAASDAPFSTATAASPAASPVSTPASAPSLPAGAAPPADTISAAACGHSGANAESQVLLCSLFVPRPAYAHHDCLWGIFAPAACKCAHWP